MSDTVARVACKCKHEQQDKMYGFGMRLANKVNKANPPKGWATVRCTVCSTQHTINESRLK
jgi:hypothetical protein